jgi:hypothetical protein
LAQPQKQKGLGKPIKLSCSYRRLNKRISIRGLVDHWKEGWRVFFANPYGQKRCNGRVLPLYSVGEGRETLFSGGVDGEVVGGGVYISESAYEVSEKLGVYVGNDGFATWIIVTGFDPRLWGWAVGFEREKEEEEEEEGDELGHHWRMMAHA